MRTKGIIVKKTILSIFLIFASTCLWADTEPSESQSLSAIQYKIESYMLNQLVGQAKGKIKVSVGKLDSRLKLKACADEQLEIFNPYDSSLLNSSTMGIKCAACRLFLRNLPGHPSPRQGQKQATSMPPAALAVLVPLDFDPPSGLKIYAPQ